MYGSCAVVDFLQPGLMDSRLHAQQAERVASVPSDLVQELVRHCFWQHTIRLGRRPAGNLED